MLMPDTVSMVANACEVTKKIVRSLLSRLLISLSPTHVILEPLQAGI